MIRLSNLLWVAMAAVVGFGLFQLKHQVQELEDEMFRLNRAILAEQQAIHVLKAEWSYINQPQRLQSLASRHLELQPMKPAQLGSLADLPVRGEEPMLATAKQPHSSDKKGLALKPVQSPLPRSTGSQPGPMLATHPGSKERR
jgi:hypothetical protein